MSKYFTLKEMNRQGVLILEIEKANLEYVARNLGDPIRSYLSIPVFVTSGFRTITYNKEIGGSPTSRHVYGLALDLWWRGIDEDSVISTFLALRKFDCNAYLEYQAIWYPEKRFIHVGLAKPGKRTEELVSVGGLYTKFVL